MGAQIEIGRGFSLPLDVVTESLAILAKRRAGKSYTARRLVEQLAAQGQQVVIVDPKGDWWGIRAHRDGKRPGLPITILGGERGDAPLERGSGELVARLVVEETVSALLDLSSFRKSELATFMVGFLETLYRLKAREAYRTPMMLVIDEADAIAPQRPSEKGDVPKMLGAVEDLVRRGGQRGIGCTLVCQRSAVLNKNVLTQAQMLVALRTIAPQDIAAMKDWIDVHGDEAGRARLLESLPSLPVGAAWFWSPGWPTDRGIFQRVKVLPIETFDSGATPKVGQRRVEPKLLAEVDLQALKRRMSETLERAKASDPRTLQRRIAELERKLADAERASAAPHEDAGAHQALEEMRAEAEERRATILAMQREVLRELEAARQFIQRHAGDLMAHLDTIEKIASYEVPELTTPAPTPRLPRHPARPSPRHRGTPGRRRSPVSVPGGSVPAASGSLRQRILDAVAWFTAAGIPNPDRRQVGFFARRTLTGGHGGNVLGSLRTDGLLDYPEPGRVTLTAAGNAVADMPARALSAEEIQGAILAFVGETSLAATILRELLAIYPQDLSREELGERVGRELTGGHGGNVVGNLHNTAKAIEYPAAGRLRAASWLFRERAR